MQSNLTKDTIVQIKVVENCPRCRRKVGERNVTSFEEAQRAANPTEATAPGLERLKVLIEQLKDEGTLPAAFVYVNTPEGVKMASQPALCNDPDAGRSCVKTLDNLLWHFETKPERAPHKPRKKKTVETDDNNEIKSE